MKYLFETIEIVKTKIETDHKIGNQSGRSGHMSYVSYILHDLKIHTAKNENKQITYWYTIYVETEFTYEPDNPPYKYNYCKMFTLTENKDIIENPYSNIENTVSQKWIETKKQITEMIKNALDKVEWGYGNNRTPIKFPPRFIELTQTTSDQYLCLIESGLNENKLPIIIESNTIEGLYSNVLDALKKKYSI
ncbi:MAG: hypothetical protein HQ541_23800 [Mariniphaga sp.]|nr:hypothetical protein [Mariniphaga sp.]